ncbi:MAG: M28 family peptidase [Planctomycetes bacterium]|nr:M28 family peptidase [Planctomycetota bacterium]MBL7009411.1 M28 family peptidase [Planctomycetota bacterium]
MRHCSRTLPVLLLGACASGSCDQQASTPLTPPAFDRDRAWADLEHLVGIGPRPMGTEALAETRRYLHQQLDGLGWLVEEFPFTAKAPPGARRQGEFTGVNLLARRPGTEAGEIWIASHYDTYDLRGFLGANDGGSSTAVLLELARQLGGPEVRQGPTLVLAWFDGEEPFSEVAWDNATNSTFGSRHQVELLRKDDALRDLRAFILLDMVGDAKLGITLPEETDQRLERTFETAALELGYKLMFFERRPIRDDHLPFYKARVPVINLIDLKFGPGLSNEWWHTAEDTLDKCSAASLGQVGEVVLAALPEVEKGFPSRR